MTVRISGARPREEFNEWTDSGRNRSPENLFTMALSSIVEQHWWYALKLARASSPWDKSLLSTRGGVFSEHDHGWTVRWALISSFLEKRQEVGKMGGGLVNVTTPRLRGSKACRSHGPILG